jgi:hypothetical protein
VICVCFCKKKEHRSQKQVNVCSGLVTATAESTAECEVCQQGAETLAKRESKAKLAKQQLPPPRKTTTSKVKNKQNAQFQRRTWH